MGDWLELLFLRHPGLRAPEPRRLVRRLLARAIDGSITVREQMKRLLSIKFGEPDDVIEGSIAILRLHVLLGGAFEIHLLLDALDRAVERRRPRPVMIIGDEAPLRDFRLMLEQRGHEVIVVTDVAYAITAIERRAPGLAVTNVRGNPGARALVVKIEQRLPGLLLLAVSPRAGGAGGSIHRSESEALCELAASHCPPRFVN